MADVRMVLNFFEVFACLAHSKYDIHSATSPGCFLVARSKILKIRAWPECVELSLIRNRLHRFLRSCSRLISHAAYRAKSTGWDPLVRTLCSKSDLFLTRFLISSCTNPMVSDTEAFKRLRCTNFVEDFLLLKLPQLRNCLLQIEPCFITCARHCEIGEIKDFLRLWIRVCSRSTSF